MLFQIGFMVSMKMQKICPNLGSAFTIFSRSDPKYLKKMSSASEEVGINIPAISKELSD